ncbi:MAG: hypothetical protein A2Z16_09440 [Chloroflexi bacterium RBG_16_54_18]|nr:MAG: hypothetical protein A2Z16_09440 [Chloroflexi bacterium RBG_16_54_18]
MEKPLFDEKFLQSLERLAILTRRTLAGQIQGERRSPKRGQSVEFADYRPYASGDDFRRIDWNAYARLERFFIKLFIEEEDITVHLLVDSSRSMDWGKPNKLEYAIRLAAALGYISMVGLDRVTVTVLGHDSRRPEHYLPPLRGKQQVFQFFSFLQSIHPDGKNPAGHLQAYAMQAASPGPVIIISDLMDDGWLNGISQLAMRGFEPTIIHLLSPDEIDPAHFTEPPLAGDFRLMDQETEQEVEITADFETLDAYHQQLEEWQRTLYRFCSQRGAVYLPAVTSIPLDTLLFSGLRKQGILR